MILMPQDGNLPNAGVATHNVRLPMRISPLQEMQPTSAHRTVIPYCQQACCLSSSLIHRNSLMGFSGINYPIL